MNHELVMLRGLEYCKNSIKELTEECLEKALKSFAHEDTLAQMVAVAQLSLQRDAFVTYLNLVQQALANMPRGYRALLVAIYVNGTPKEKLCERYNVSLSTVYRKLTKARLSFRNKLQALGCTESWFVQIFGNTEWVHAMLVRTHNGARMAQ